MNFSAAFQRIWTQHEILCIRVPLLNFDENFFGNFEAKRTQNGSNSENAYYERALDLDFASISALAFSIVS